MRQKRMKRRTFLQGAAGSALLALAPGLRAGGSTMLPPYLEAYRNLYQSDPHAAALEWFRDARFEQEVLDKLVENTISERRANFEDPRWLGYALGEFAQRGKDSGFLSDPSNAQAP